MVGAEQEITSVKKEVGSHEPSNHDPATLKLIQTTLHDYVFLTFIILNCFVIIQSTLNIHFEDGTY